MRRKMIVPPPEDLQMEFVTDLGVRIKIYDTCCKNFGPEEKKAADARMMEIYRRSYIKKLLQEQNEVVRM